MSDLAFTHVYQKLFKPPWTGQSTALKTQACVDPHWLLQLLYLKQPLFAVGAHAYLLRPSPTFLH